MKDKRDITIKYLYNLRNQIIRNIFKNYNSNNPDDKKIKELSAEEYKIDEILEILNKY